VLGRFACPAVHEATVPHPPAHTDYVEDKSGPSGCSTELGPKAPMKVAG
jgi:hypothetical protein